MLVFPPQCSFTPEYVLNRDDVIMTSLTFDNEYQQHDEGQLEELSVQLVQKRY